MNNQANKKGPMYMIRRTRPAALFLALVLSLSLIVPVHGAGPDSDAALAAAQTAMQYGGAVSVQYALWQDGEITLSGQAGVYSKTENTQLAGEHLYGVGSISKVYTAAAMMKLAEAGRVDLDKPVTDYVPDFTMADERYRQITVRMLLNHSSGLMGSASGGSFLFGDGQERYPIDHLLERLAGQRLQADPGAYSVYSNDSFTLAQLVIERVSGMDFTAFLHQEITGPLGLENTLTPADDFDTDRLARTYVGQETRHTPGETLVITGTGGIYANASDLAAFGGAFCNDSLLTQASRDAMAADEYLRGMWPADSEGDALAYGLGWDSVHMFPFSQSGIQALVKGGDTIVYHAGLVVLPEYKMACAVLTSGGISTYNQAAAARILIDALAAQGVTVEESASLPEAVPAAMPAGLKAMSGSYGTSTSVMEADISGEGVLTLNVSGQVAGTYSYYSDGSFRDEENSLLFRPVQGDNGETYLFQKAYAELPGLTTVCAASYAGQRLPACAPDAETRAAWEAREGKTYLQVNEPPSSALYALSSVFGSVSLENMPEGYLLTNQLTSPDLASPVLQIPGTGSRDSAEIRFFQKDGLEYMEINGGIYLETAGVNPIYPGSASFCTIQPGETGHWYQVGESAGKVMTVQVPDNAGFYVYDAAFGLAGSSWLYGDTSVTLPEGGWIVFAGSEGDRFGIQLAQP